jgi:hypothetical protein
MNLGLYYSPLPQKYIYSVLAKETTSNTTEPDSKYLNYASQTSFSNQKASLQSAPATPIN